MKLVMVYNFSGKAWSPCKMAKQRLTRGSGLRLLESECREGGKGIGGLEVENMGRQLRLVVRRS